MRPLRLAEARTLVIEDGSGVGWPGYLVLMDEGCPERCKLAHESHFHLSGYCSETCVILACEIRHAAGGTDGESEDV